MLHLITVERHGFHEFVFSFPGSGRSLVLSQNFFKKFG